MKTMTVTDFKAHALQVVEQVFETREPVVVTKRGRPVAELVPFTSKKPAGGKLAETLVFEHDIVSPLGEDIWNACSSASG